MLSHECEYYVIILKYIVRWNFKDMFRLKMLF